MKDRFEIRLTVASDSIVGKDTAKAVGKAIGVVASRYAKQFDRIVEAFVKDIETEKEGGQDNGPTEKK